MGRFRDLLHVLMLDGSHNYYTLKDTKNRRQQFYVAGLI